MLLARSSGKRSKRSLKEKGCVENKSLKRWQGFPVSRSSKPGVNQESSLIAGPLLMEVSGQRLNSLFWGPRKYLPFTTSTLRLNTF